MDKIQTAIISVVGLSGALTILIPDAPQAANQQANAPSKSDKTEPAKSQPAEIEEEAEEESEFSDEIPTFGEPSGFGDIPSSGSIGNSDEESEETVLPTVAKSRNPGRSNNSSANSAQTSANRFKEKPNPTEQPQTLSDAGLRNASGGTIAVSQEDIDNAREF